MPKGLTGDSTSVSVVVTMVDGEPFATTAGSVVAASWQPPLLAVFFQAGSRMAAALDWSGRFTVNVLGEAGHGLARRFARPGREQGWAALRDVALYRRDPAPPVLVDAAAWIDCATARTIPLGDHVLYVGAVRDLGRDGAAAPLAYYRGRFRGLGPAIAPATWTAIDVADLQAVW